MSRIQFPWIGGLAIAVLLAAAPAAPLGASPVSETAAAKKTVVELWSTDNEEYRIVVYEKVADHFMAQNPDIDVRIVPIDEATTSQRIASVRRRLVGTSMGTW